MKNKKIHKRIIAVSATVAVVLSLCACASEKKESQTLPVNETPAYQVNLDAITPQAYNNVDGLDLEPGTYISIIGRSSGDPYWDTLKAGVDQATADINERMGYTGNDKIKVTYNAPDNSTDIDDQVNILDEELSRYPDVIGFASVDENACTVQFDLATESDIPIVAFDSSNTYSGILCTVKTNNISAGATVATNLSTEIKDAGSVMIIANDSLSNSSLERVIGFTDELTANHPNVLVAETLYNDKMDDMKEMIATEKNTNLPEGETETTAGDLSNEDVIEYYLEKHPDVKAIYTTNATTTQLAISACEQMDRLSSTTIMGFDAGKTQLDSLKDGDISGLLIQNPFGMGYATVVACARTVLEQGNEAVVDTGSIWVTKDNVDDEAIANMLYE